MKLFWEVTEYRTLNTAVRAWLAATYPTEPVPPANHNRGAIITVQYTSPSGGSCWFDFPYTYVNETTLLGDVEEAIDLSARARVKARRNLLGLANILGVRHPL